MVSDIILRYDIEPTVTIEGRKIKEEISRAE